MSKHEPEKPDKKSGYTVGDLLALQAENADLKAKLAAYEPPAPEKVEYPKWLYRRDAEGQILDQVLVADEAERATLAKGWGA